MKKQIRIRIKIQTKDYISLKKRQQKTTVSIIKHNNEYETKKHQITRKNENCMYFIIIGLLIKTN